MLLSAAAISLAAGPSAAVAEAQYEFRAWAARAEAARSLAASKKAPADSGTSDQNPESDGSRSKSERSFNCFFVPPSAKPTDTKSSGDLPVLSVSPVISFHQADAAELVSEAPLSAPTPLHRPAHRAHAPPRA